MLLFRATDHPRDFPRIGPRFRLVVVLGPVLREHLYANTALLRNVSDFGYTAKTFYACPVNHFTNVKDWLKVPSIFVAMAVNVYELLDGFVKDGARYARSVAAFQPSQNGAPVLKDCHLRNTSHAAHASFIFIPHPPVESRAQIGCT